MCHQVFESAVRLFRRAEADVLAHRPGPRAVHVRVDAARERVLAGAPDIALEIDVGEVLGAVDGLDREARVRSYFLHLSLASFVNTLTIKPVYGPERSEEHTSELQSRPHLVCRLLLENKKARDMNM